MKCTGTAYIYRTLEGEYVRSKLICEGEEDCPEGSKCKEIEVVQKGPYSSITRKFCQCKTGNVVPKHPEHCHMEIVIFHHFGKVVHAEAYCVGGGCEKKLECKMWTAKFSEVTEKGQILLVEESRCECGVILGK